MMSSHVGSHRTYTLPMITTPTTWLANALRRELITAPRNKLIGRRSSHHHDPPVTENRWKMWPPGELNGNWQVWAAMVHPVSIFERKKTADMRASWTVWQWDHGDTLSQLRGCWNSKADNWAPNSMNHTLIFYFLTRSCTDATASKQVIAGRVRSSLNFFKLRLLRRHSKYYRVFAFMRPHLGNAWWRWCSNTLTSGKQIIG